jgi:hypothetical protein
MSNQETQSSPAQLMDITITAKMGENTKKVELNLKKNTECSINFMANTFLGVIKADEDLRVAMLLAVGELLSDAQELEPKEKQIDDITEELLSLLKDFKGVKN